MAGLYSAGQMPLAREKFIAFHLSGGTTEALLVQKGEKKPFDICKVAATLDLKAGQAVDRVGVMLGLSFPAGPQLEQLALQSDQKYRIRVPMKGANCSLSGVENQCARMLQEGKKPADIANYCLCYILTALDKMSEALLKTYGPLPLLYVGGVMSNQRIRSFISGKYSAFFASPAFSSDNAAGVAVLSCFSSGEI